MRVTKESYRRIMYTVMYSLIKESKPSLNLFIWTNLVFQGTLVKNLEVLLSWNV